MKAAEQGNVEAEYVLGGCYLNAVGTKTDYEKANAWFQKATDDGHITAAFELGESYLDGRGIAQNPDLGIHFLEIAANGGAKEACQTLAQRYHYGIKNYQGEAIYKNGSLALRYAKLAAEDESNGVALFLIGVILETDFDNPSEALDWYRKAVRAGGNIVNVAKLHMCKIYFARKENGSSVFNMLSDLVKGNNGEAQYLFAQCLEQGFGCEKNRKMAKEYYQLAEKNGFVPVSKPKKRFGLF